MSKTEELSANMEDYLETIFQVVGEKQAARAKDIAKRLKVNNSSVTGALRTLKDKELINWAPYDVITLTQKGRRLAEDIVRRHEALEDFFTKVLRLDRKEAEDAACKMEHAISRTVLDRLIRFTEFVQICPRGGEDWIDQFWNRCSEGCTSNTLYEDCQNCLSSCLKDVREKVERQRQISGQEFYLNQMTPGQRGRILKIVGRGQVKRRLAKMEILPGNIVEMESIDKDQGSMDVKIKGYHITLRLDDASRVEVNVY